MKSSLNSYGRRVNPTFISCFSNTLTVRPRHVLNEIVEGSGGIFQVRSFKEFTSARGKDRLLSLRLLSDLTYDEPMDYASGSDTSPGSRLGRRSNVHDFMRGRQEDIGDPTSKKWNAEIRLSNFITVENAPFCVCTPTDKNCELINILHLAFRRRRVDRLFSPGEGCRRI